MDDQVIWMIVGFAGQALFASSFLVQWVHSERKQRSLIPQAFWYLRASGGVVLLAYALFRMDPVFIIGQFGGLFIYGRNIHLILKARGEPVAGG